MHQYLQIFTFHWFKKTLSPLSSFFLNAPTSLSILFLNLFIHFVCFFLLNTGQPEQEKILQLTQKHLLDYAKQGLRTLFMARRVIPQDVYRAWAQQMSQAENSVGNNTEELIFEAVCNIETDLELLGKSIFCLFDFYIFTSHWSLKQLCRFTSLDHNLYIASAPTPV